MVWHKNWALAKELHTKLHKCSKQKKKFCFFFGIERCSLIMPVHEIIEQRDAYLPGLKQLFIYLK